MSIIRMKYPFLDEIAKYAKEHLPEEACGLIAGSEDENGRLITKVYYLTNTDHAEDHFTMDPKEQLAAIKDMRANGLKPLGNWHSHPSSPSRPSDEDIKLAYDPSASYMIMSFMDRSRKRIYEYILMNITSKSYVNVLSRSESCKEKSASSKMAFLF